MCAFKGGKLKGIKDLLKKQEANSIKDSETIKEVHDKIEDEELSERQKKLDEIGKERPAPDGRPHVIELKNVTKKYIDEDENEIIAVKDINFKIEDIPVVSEMVVFLGASGCGKSTILKIIAGLIKKGEYEGEALYFNKPIEAPGSERSMVFQDYSSFPWRNVIQNVAFGLELKGVKKRERELIAKRFIRMVGLSEREKLYPANLSGGQRQRVAIARTLAVNSRCILMDEPFGALDISTRYEMQELLCKIYTEIEKTIIMVTHDIGEAVYLADKIFLMTPSPGQIAEEIEIPLPRDEYGRRNRESDEYIAIEKKIRSKMISIVEGTYGKKD